MELTLHAPAKVNLTLIVGARRDDGYHDVSTVMQTVGLYDTLTLTEGGSGLTMTCTDPDLPTDGSNLVLRAAALFCQELHLPVPDLHLHLQKRIPSQAGLGGGSSDAAAVLRALRSLYAPNLPDAELERMAAALGHRQGRAADAAAPADRGLVRGGQAAGGLLYTGHVPPVG